MLHFPIPSPKGHFAGPKGKTNQTWVQIQILHIEPLGTSAEGLDLAKPYFPSVKWVHMIRRVVNDGCKIHSRDRMVSGFVMNEQKPKR